MDEIATQHEMPGYGNQDVDQVVRDAYDTFDRAMFYCPKTNPTILDKRDRGTCCDNAAFCARKAAKILEFLEDEGLIHGSDIDNRKYLEMRGTACSGGRCETALGVTDIVLRSPSYKDAQEFNDGVTGDEIVLFNETPFAPQKYIDAMNDLTEAKIPETAQQVPSEHDTPLPTGWVTDIKQGQSYFR